MKVRFLATLTLSAAKVGAGWENLGVKPARWTKWESSVPTRQWKSSVPTRRRKKCVAGRWNSLNPSFVSTSFTWHRRCRLVAQTETVEPVPKAMPCWSDFVARCATTRKRSNNQFIGRMETRGSRLHCKVDSHNIETSGDNTRNRTNSEGKYKTQWRRSYRVYSEHRTMEADTISSLKRCRTVHDIEKTLREAPVMSTAPKVLMKCDMDVGGDMIRDKIVTEIGANVAAKALRRIVDIRLDPRRRRPLIEGMDGGVNVNENSERESALTVTRRLVPALLENLGAVVLIALRHKNNGNKTVAVQEDSISSHNQVQDATGDVFLSPYAITDLLHSLAKLSGRNRSKRGDNGVKPLAERVCIVALSSDGAASFVKGAGPSRLVEVLAALATMDLTRQEDLLGAIGNRLMLADATGVLSPTELSTSLWAYAVLDVLHTGLLKSFSRRMRKQAVRDKASVADLVRALFAAGRSIENLNRIPGLAKVRPFVHGIEGESPNSQNDAANPDPDVTLLRDDLETMCHTLVRELMKPDLTSTVRAVTERRKATPTMLNKLSAGQVADILSTCVTIEMNGSLLSDFGEHLGEEKVIEKSTCRDIARILWSLQRLQMKDHPDAVRRLGQRFFHLADEEGATFCDPKTFTTTLRSAALLYPRNQMVLKPFCDAARLVLVEKSEEAVVEKSEETYIPSEHSESTQDYFVSRCNEFEVSNVVWFMAMTQWYDQEVLVILADRILHKNVLHTCSPSSASRILWSYTTLMALNQFDAGEGQNDNDHPDAPSTEAKMRKVLFDLFHGLGGILLSSQLAPVDASSALVAYAKASYSLDLGIFDHLAEALAQDTLLEKATVKQVSQALWACGKMIDWEDPSHQLEHGTHTEPPYLRCAKKYAQFLASRRDTMSAKDVAQAIWSLGRLKVSDDAIVKPLASAASSVAPQCNSQEIANMLWGLSKLAYDNNDVVTALTDRMSSPSLRQRCSPQEAASTMYALGRMKIQDKAVFAQMSAVMMENLGETSAQAIANALWAHQAVKIEPPTELFNCWAEKKLGIVGLYVDEPSELHGMHDEAEDGDEKSSTNQNLT